MTDTPKPRRRKGTGSVYPRGDGFAAQIDLGKDATGKRIRKTFSGPSVQAVQQQQEEWLANYREGLDADAIRSLTIEHLLTRWIEHLDATMRDRQPRTYDSYAMIVTRHLIPAFGAAKVRAVTPADVERLAAAERAKGLSSRTASYHRAVLRIALNWGIKQGWITRNVAALADIKEEPKQPVESLSVKDAKRIIAYPHRLRVLWLVALTTGLRVGELLGLQWQDVDLDKGVLFVRRQLQRINHELTYRPVKTTGSAAPVLLAPVTTAALKYHRAQHGGKQGEPVFLSTDRTLIEPTNVTRSWRALLGKLGIDYIKFHAARHTCGSLLYDAGVPDKVIQSVLRHARVSTTMDTYIHPSADSQQRAAAAMERLFGEEKKPRKGLRKVVRKGDWQRNRQRSET